MTWTSVPLTSTCDLADPGWTNAEAPESACDAANNTAYGFDDDTLADTGTRSTPANWTVVAIESVCD